MSSATQDLLDQCAQRIGRTLDPLAERRLRRWAEGTNRAADRLVDSLLARPEHEWTAVIFAHRAHRHDWYKELAQRATIRDFAVFLLENRAFPAFVPLLQRLLDAQICDEGRAAIQRNLADEQIPVPHAELMARLMSAVKERAGADLRLESYPSLVNRTLVFYYGYYCDPWHLVGSLFATEAMAYRRVTRMGAGLARLGLDEADMEFIRIHSNCDDEHARDWIDGVIVPSVRMQAALRPAIATGIATCLETSARYLDDLLSRARRDRAVA